MVVYHSWMEAAARKKARSAFRQGSILILVAIVMGSKASVWLFFTYCTVVSDATE
ncbi:MAG: hypothetical protein LBV77_01745 [Candidatus Adiutrix intracellularis]|nr:hypothetical protein [Candidatus Adiutrix intracellularis]